MSYEYKHEVMLYEIAESFFKDLVQYDSETGEMLNETDIREELNGVRDEIKHVYAQATKADEYEAKAKAFDEVMDLYVNGSNKYLQTKRHTLDVFIEDVAEILKPFTDKYESGETNV